MVEDWHSPVLQPEEADRDKRRGWGVKFREAFHGIKLGVRRDAGFYVHFYFATLAVLAAIVLGCNVVEWCLILLCISMVVSIELLNSSLETLFHGLDAATKNRLVGVLDISAGAVLVASIFAAVIGVIIFGSKIVDLASN